MYVAIILLSVAVCGFEVPIVLPTTLEEEAEAVEDNKEKTRQREGGREGYTNSAHGNPHQTFTTITPSKLLTKAPDTPPYLSNSYTITKTKQQRLSHS